MKKIYCIILLFIIIFISLTNVKKESFINYKSVNFNISNSKSFSCRFDLMAKYLYIKFKEKNIESDFFKELYKQHIITFNNCIEDNKKTCNDFINSFNNLIENIKKNGFDTKYPIPVGKNNIITNGAHRYVICYFYKKNYLLEKNNTNLVHCDKWNYKYFINKNNNPLSSLYADTMALEYIKVNSNIRTMIVYPSVYKYNKLNEIENIINKYGNIYYKKTINLNNTGLNNLINEIYRGEDWIGGMFPKINQKTQNCLGDKDSKTIIILINMVDLSKSVEMKEKCRSLFNLGKHSLHVCDYTIDSYRVGCSLLNNNSIHFLNNSFNKLSINTEKLLKTYFDSVGDNNEDYCVTSSISIELYGLRNAKDLDYLHKNDNNLNLKDINIHSNKWLNYYHINKDEIIYNPKYYFYFNGYKFATLEVIKKMKENRSEKKDIKDIKLINSIN